MVVTIDGLAVNGKSTLARMICNHFDFKFFNTGAIYRCIALYIIENNLNIDRMKKLIPMIEGLKIDFEDDKVYLNGEDVTDKIKTEGISIYSTKWATIPEIKEIVRAMQKKFIKENNTVMEGRDIGTRIAPNADIKFYLYSDFETRVERLWKEEKNLSIEEIRSSLKTRDYLDLNGGNFVKPEDAIEIDTTDYNIDEVHEIMMIAIHEKMELKQMLFKKDN